MVIIWSGIWLQCVPLVVHIDKVGSGRRLVYQHNKGLVAVQVETVGGGSLEFDQAGLGRTVGGIYSFLFC